MHDVIIIGGGPAGLAAGIYSCRAGAKTLLLEKLVPGGQTNLTALIENYPGFPEGIPGQQLMQKMKLQATEAGLEIISGEVTKIEKKIVTAKDTKYKTLAIIVATGAQPRKLGVPGEEKFLGKGVSYCATCDGPLFKGQDIVVVGGGNTAAEEASFLTKFARKVILIHRRDTLRSSRILQERVLGNKKIEIVWDSSITEILGGERVAGVRVKNKKTGNEEDISCAGIFVSIGTIPATKFLSGIVSLDKEGYILTNEGMKTSTEGIYACGDCRKKLLRQIITACGEGALAAVEAVKYVEELKGSAYPGD
jgi:thioredoxin reductase (NADPH)